MRGQTGVISVIMHSANAAIIEAARAGGAGQDFDVLTKEIRVLAQSTEKLAQDIRNIIMSSGRQVEEGVQLVGEAYCSMNVISEPVDGITLPLEDISHSTTGEAESLERIHLGHQRNEADDPEERGHGRAGECSPLQFRFGQSQSSSSYGASFAAALTGAVS